MQIDEMYRLYYPKIYNYVYYRLMSRERTEDIVSSVFVKVISKWDTFDESKASFGTWICRIAQNTLTDYYRTNKQATSIEDLDYEVSVDFDGDDQIIQEETNREVYCILKTLKESERELVYMKYYADMKNKQIASALDMTETAVSTKLSRILKKLRVVMEQEDYAELRFHHDE